MNARLLICLLWLTPFLCSGASYTSYFYNVEAITNVVARSAVRGLTGVFTNSITLNGDTRTAWPLDATAGNVINTGASVAGQVPKYLDATGTNIGPTSVSIINNTNISAGVGTFTNGLTAGASTFTGQVLLEDGTVAAPSIAFSSNTNLGFYRVGSNSIGLGDGTNPKMSVLQTSGSFQFASAATLGWTSGSSSQATPDTYIGRDSPATTQLGIDAASPAAQSVKGPDGSGTDKTSGGLTLDGGKPTGTGLPQRVWAKTTTTSAASSATAQTYTASFSLGGTLKVDTTTTGNVDGGEDNLISYALTAGQLSVNGDYIEFDTFGTFAATANTKQLKAYFGGTALLDSTSLILNNIPWRIHGKIIRTSATAQKTTAEMTIGGTLLGATTTTITSYTTPAETLANSITFKVTGQDTGGVPASDAVVQQGMVIRFYPNGN